MTNKISPQDVRALREKSGAGMLEVKKALEESGGNIDQAVEILRKKGRLKAQKKSDRAARAGLIESYVHGEGRIGVLVEVNCETDFVARNEEFKRLVHELALQIAAMQPSDVAELLKQPFIRDQGTTVKELVSQTVAKLGENVQIRRFVRYVLGE